MVYKLKVVATFIALMGILISSGCMCHISYDKNEGLAAKRFGETERLMLAMESYVTKHGKLPVSLAILKSENPSLVDIDIRLFTYETGGITVADSTVWLVSTPDPFRKGRLVVGKLPVEVASRAPSETGEQ